MVSGLALSHAASLLYRRAGTRWSLRTLQPAPGYVAALAIEQVVAKEKTLTDNFDGLFRGALKVIR